MIQFQFRIPGNYAKFRKCISDLIQKGYLFECDILYLRGESRLNAKGIMWVGLIQPGQTISLMFDGKDEWKAQEMYQNLF